MEKLGIIVTGQKLTPNSRSFFKAPNVCLQRFRRRNEIVFMTISGESNDVNEETVKEYPSLRAVIAQ